MRFFLCSVIVPHITSNGPTILKKIPVTAAYATHASEGPRYELRAVSAAYIVYPLETGYAFQVSMTHVP